MGGITRLQWLKWATMYVFLETVEQLIISQIILKRCYNAIIESVFTFSVTVWFGRASYEEKAQLETPVRCASNIIGLTLPTIESVYHTRWLRKSKNIMRDVTHPANHIFELLQSGKRYHFLVCSDFLSASYFSLCHPNLHVPTFFSFPCTVTFPKTHLTLANCCFV